MALPSQTARSNTGVFSGGAFSTSRRPRPAVRPLIILGVLALSMGLVYAIWPKNQAEAGPGQPSDTPARAAPKPAPTQPASTRSQPAASRGTQASLGASSLNTVGRPSDVIAKPASAAEPAVNNATRLTMGSAGAATTPAVASSAPVATRPPTTTPPPASPPAPAAAPAEVPTEPRPAVLLPVRAPQVQTLLDRADAAMARNRPVEARDALNLALHAPQTTGGDQQMIRERMAAISESVTFSKSILSDDPMTAKYAVASGDNLARIVRNEGLKVDWRFIQRINGIPDPTKLRVGQSLKLIRGPFHAIVDKSDFRLDLYADARDSGGNRLFIRSFPVGLGEYGSTPLGNWVVRQGSKLVNPAWTNPRTGESFSADDPKNPIGERWIGLDGADPGNRDKSGYGIHGTIEPRSIGREMSMGCIRLGDDDVALVYELLAEGGSTVEVRP